MRLEVQQIAQKRYDLSDLESAFRRFETLLRHVATGEELEDAVPNSWADLAREVCGTDANARQVYLHGLMHGRLQALDWVLDQRNDLYPQA